MRHYRDFKVEFEYQSALKKWHFASGGKNEYAGEG